jgi:predicted HTH transcriptional regulator
MTADQIEEAVAAGEGRTREFKRTLPPEPIVARYLTAFANTEGGLFLVGVDARGEIAGLPETDAAEIAQRLRRITTSLFSWSVEIGTVSVRGR